MSSMITMRELIQDPTYKAFLQTKPVTPRHHRDANIMKSGSWVVYVQKVAGGPWGRKTFWKYSDAFKFLKKVLKAGVYDAALNNKRYPTNPPGKVVRIKGKFQKDSKGEMRQVTKVILWKPKLTGDDAEHHWCLYCRRPTLFRFYTKHRALKLDIDPTVPRCCICGASSRIALHPSDRSFRVH